MRPVTVRNGIVTESVSLGPAVARTIVSAQQSIDPRKMHGEVLVAGCIFRTVMPVMKTRRHDHVLDVAKPESYVRVDEDRVK